MTDGRVRTVEISGSFFSVLAHDLRSPIGVVEGAARALVPDDDGEPLRALLWRGVRQLDHLANRLALIGELQQGTIVARPISVHTSDLVARALELTQRVDPRRDVATRFEPPDPDPEVFVDRDRTVFALVEILLESARHARARVLISGRAGDADDAELVIEDDGVPLAQPEFAFDRRHDRREVGRDAVQLSLAHDLVSLQGGTLRLEPQADGVRLVLRLPRGERTTTGPPFTRDARE